MQTPRTSSTGADERFHSHDGASSNLHARVRAAPDAAASPQPLFSLDAVPRESRDVLDRFDAVVESVRSLSGKQQVQLAGDIKRLSHALTDERTSRRLGYMNDAGAVSAYISYFMWWNLVRLTRLFAALPPSAFALSDGDAVLDVGSGTLTVPIALWLARPDLRQKRLTVYCMDLSQNALAAGEELFLAVAAQTIAASKPKAHHRAAPDDESAQNDAGAECADECASAEPWRIVRVKSALDDGVPLREKAALITCANVFNEITQASPMPPDFLAKKYARALLQYARAGQNGAPSGSILLVEPGDPKSARFVSLMRDALLRKDYAPASPCPHSGTCPMSGRRTDAHGVWSGKWCNFAFATDDAPQALLKLSERAGLQKDRASLSFVLMQPTAASGARIKSPAALPPTDGTHAAPSARAHGEERHTSRIAARIASDAIHLPQLHATGYYACSERGLLLALDRRHLQPKNGDLLAVRAPKADAPTDKKSGATIVEL